MGNPSHSTNCSVMSSAATRGTLRPWVMKGVDQDLTIHFVGMDVSELPDMYVRST